MLGLLGAAISGAGIIGGMFSRGKANRDLQRLLGQDPTYTANPLVAQQLGLTQTQLNGRMPGAAPLENNIYGTQANTFANVEKNATNSSQALALAGDVQGQSNQAFSDLSLKEMEDYQRRYGNYSGAVQNQVAEGDKVYQDKIRRFQDMASIKGAQAQNRAANWGSLTGLGTSFLSAGIMGEKKPFDWNYNPN